jgi:hypothetical protein
MQDGDERQRLFHRLAVDQDVVVLADPRGQFPQAMAIDGHRAFKDERFARAPGTEAGPGKILI